MLRNAFSFCAFFPRKMQAACATRVGGMNEFNLFIALRHLSCPLPLPTWHNNTPFNVICIRNLINCCDSRQRQDERERETVVRGNKCSMKLHLRLILKFIWSCQLKELFYGNRWKILMNFPFAASKSVWDNCNTAAVTPCGALIMCSNWHNEVTSN